MRDLYKVFQVRERAPGLRGALRGLFSAPTRDVPAVDGITFSIAQGERVAFVGPNAAGKPTTLKALSGILHPTSGEVAVLGLVPWRQRSTLGFRLGTVFGQRTQLWYHLPAIDTFDLPGVVVVSRAPHRTVLEVNVAATPVKAVAQAALGASRPNDLTVEDPPMEEIVQASYASAHASGPEPVVDRRTEAPP